MGRTLKPGHGLTMKALSERLATKFNEEPFKVSRLLQTWINTNIVKPEGPVHSGPGRYRTFTNEELDKAALIFELHRYHFPLHQLQTIRQELDDALVGEHKDVLNEARQGKAWKIRVGLKVNKAPWLGCFTGKDYEYYMSDIKKVKDYMGPVAERRSRLILEVDTILQDL
jgi:hypothetical protein